MFIENLGEIKAVAFDIDGTLYRTWRLNVRMCIHFLCHNQFFLKYGLVRNDMHKMDVISNFMDVQAELMGKRLRCDAQRAAFRLDKIVYSGLQKYFKKIKPCTGVVDFIKDLKAKGLKIGILSDFPPEQKGELWGIKNYCDVMLGSESTGALKPASHPFNMLAKALDVKPEEILYVGNSHKYDVVGSKSIGMKSAWLISPIKGFLGKKSKQADITFWHYSQLKKILLPESSE